MSFWQREYECYIILGSCGTPWLYSEWMPFTELLSPITKACRDKGLLRVSQMDSATKKWLKYGRTEWRPEHHTKWTHGSPATSGKDSTWGFYFVEASFPSLPQCEKDGRPPDLYFVVLNEAFSMRERSPAFNPRFFFALASDLQASIHDGLRQAVLTLASQYQSILKGTIHRPWGTPFGSGFTNAIQDISFTGLFKVGNYHARPVTFETLVESWKEI